MTPAILLKGVTKRFGQMTAVQPLDLVVPRGALYGVIGPNGAGKTTSIRMIMSILFPDAGEPFSGLDPVSTRQLRELIVAEHDRGATILFSTHVMAHAEELCDHIVMIHRGHKVLDQPVAAIRAQFDPRAVRFEPIDPAADL